MNDNNNNKKAIIAILIVLLLGLSTFGYLNYQEQVQVEEKLIAEKNEVLLAKQEVLEELSFLEDSYSKALVEKTELSGDLEERKNEIIRFKTSLSKFKGADLGTIKFLKNKVKDLTFTLKDLLVANDSLVSINGELALENEKLTIENKFLLSDLSDKSKLITLLTKKNKLIQNQQSKFDDENEPLLTSEDFEKIGGTSQKSEFDSKLSENTSSKINVSTYNERRGKLRETRKAKITNVFKVSFTVETEEVPKNFKAKAYLVIKDDSGKVLSVKDFFIDANDKKIKYSKAVTISSKKRKNLAAQFSVTVHDQRLEKGTYSIDVYVNRKLIKQVTKVLT
ncbi:MAG: hypothetical protein L3J23_08190 [Flavobacteriaceae bacterium]|nr:hypothetical protein [Flavobacteriaceae bacterium]